MKSTFHLSPRLWAMNSRFQWNRLKIYQKWHKLNRCWLWLWPGVGGPWSCQSQWLQHSRWEAEIFFNNIALVQTWKGQIFFYPETWDSVRKHWNNESCEEVNTLIYGISTGSFNVIPTIGLYSKCQSKKKVSRKKRVDFLLGQDGQPNKW